MLNFLPQKNKKQIIFEYLLRVTIFLCLFVFVSSLVMSLMFMPSFFFVKYKNDTVNGQLLSIKQKNIDKGEDPIAFIKNINKLSLALSDNAGTNITYADIISKIVSLKKKEIKISSIDITEDNITRSKKVSLNGVASTRDSLTLFSKDIKTDGFFTSVVFPVTNFIKSSNSEFSATLTL